MDDEGNVAWPGSLASHTRRERALARSVGISPNIFLLGQTLPPSLARSLARGESLETESVPVVPLLLTEARAKAWWNGKSE